MIYGVGLPKCVGKQKLRAATVRSVLGGQYQINKEDQSKFWKENEQ